VAANLTSARVDPPGGLRLLNDEVIACRACPRLVNWREQVAMEKRAAYRDEQYWGRPVPGFGDPAARIAVVGLAPAAHGGNRTGRVFTGDRSGDWLIRAMFRAGMANQPTSVDVDDGLQLRDAWITAPVKCAPPDNAPTPAERATCAPFLTRELKMLDPHVIVCLGGFGYAAVAAHYRLRPRPKFGHGVEVVVPGGPTVLCSYHPSQQNTFTGRLTEPMLDAVFERAAVLSRA
jgi:uracil-DNA glycosylase family 4